MLSYKKVRLLDKVFHTVNFYAIHCTDIMPADVGYGKAWLLI